DERGPEIGRRRDDCRQGRGVPSERRPSGDRQRTDDQPRNAAGPGCHAVVTARPLRFGTAVVLGTAVILRLEWQAVARIPIGAHDVPGVRGARALTHSNRASWRSSGLVMTSARIIAAPADTTRRRLARAKWR